MGKYFYYEWSQFAKPKIFPPIHSTIDWDWLLFLFTFAPASQKVWRRIYNSISAYLRLALFISQSITTSTTKKRSIPALDSNRQLMQSNNSWLVRLWWEQKSKTRLKKMNIDNVLIRVVKWTNMMVPHHWVYLIRDDFDDVRDSYIWWKSISDDGRGKKTNPFVHPSSSVRFERVNWINDVNGEQGPLCYWRIASFFFSPNSTLKTTAKQQKNQREQ